MVTPRSNSIAVDVYFHTRDLMQLLNVDLQFASASQKSTVLDNPEVQLMSLLIIVVKLWHPFDTEDRCIQDINDSSSLTIDWNTWAKISQRPTDNDGQAQTLQPGDEIKISDRDILKLPPNQLDQYLHWYARHWVDDKPHPNERGGLPGQLLEVFPMFPNKSADVATSDMTGSSCLRYKLIDDRLKKIQGTLKLREAHPMDHEASQSTPMRCVGELYERFRYVGELTPRALDFFSAAADAISISVSSLVSAVSQLESRLERWRQSRTGTPEDQSKSHTETQSPEGVKASSA